MGALSDRMRKLLRHGDLWLIFGLFGTILLLILPIPPFLLDLLLTVSIGLSLLTLLVILYLRTPAEFTGFPTLLLFITLYRLALNVASTRLILLDGYAGHIIESFGNFVVRGNYVVGMVVFCILVLINFIVITKGAGRIAEVAARFTLDAMPGKQMAIDAELNAGLINETEARNRRRGVEEEADFYGAMDGASKFVRGDAIAAILITLINIIGGFAIGIMQKGMTMNEALSRFTMLSIGDGLVSQVPGANYVGGRRYFGDARHVEKRSGPRIEPAAFILPESIDDSRGDAWLPGDCAGFADDAVSHDVGAHRPAVVFNSQKRNAGICDGAMPRTRRQA